VRDSDVKITTMYLPTMEKKLPDIPNIQSEDYDKEVGTNTFIIHTITHI